MPFEWAKQPAAKWNLLLEAVTRYTLQQHQEYFYNTVTCIQHNFIWQQSPCISHSWNTLNSI